MNTMNIIRLSQGINGLFNQFTIINKRINFNFFFKSVSNLFLQHINVY